MLNDFLTNILSAIAYDLLKALLPSTPSKEDVLRELQSELRRHSEEFQALQAVLTHFGAQHVVRVGKDVNSSVIVIGNGNQLTIPDEGLLAGRWLAWRGSTDEARHGYLESLANLYAYHTFPLSKISFNAAMEQVFQPPALTPYSGEWRPSLRLYREGCSLESLLSDPSRYILTGLLGEGKSTILRYLAWTYAAQPEGHFLPGVGERVPFLTSVRRLYKVWQQESDLLNAWSQAIKAEAPSLEVALIRRVLEDATNSGNALILLDALDEAHLLGKDRADFLSNLSALWRSLPWQSNFLLLTSRPHALLQCNFKQFAIQEMPPLAIQRLAYGLGQSLLEERVRSGLLLPAGLSNEAILVRLMELAERTTSSRFGTPFYVTLLVLATLRSLDLEASLLQAKSLRRLPELYNFFLRQTLNWEREKPDADALRIPEEHVAMLALAETAWESFADENHRAGLETQGLSVGERTVALNFWEQVGLLWRDEFSGCWEFTHPGFKLFGAALQLHFAWAHPSLRSQLEALHRSTALNPDWSDVWELFYGLSSD